MTISVRCSGCQKIAKAPDSLAGKTVKCPACKTPIPIPKPKEAEDSNFVMELDEDESASQASESATESKAKRATRKEAKGGGRGTKVRSRVGKDTQGAESRGSGRPRRSGSKKSSPSLALIGGAGGGILALVAVLYFVVFSGGGATAESFSYLPANADMVAMIDVQQLMKISQIRTAVSEASSEIQRQYPLKATGISMETLRSISFAGNMKNQRNKDALAVLTFTSKVNAQTLYTNLKSKGFVDKSYGGKTGIIHERKRLAILAVSDTVVLFGSPENVSSAASGGPSIRDNAALMSACKNGNLSDMIVLAALLPSDASMLPGTPGGAIQNVLVRGNGTSGSLAVNVNLTCKDASVATTLHAQLSQAVGGMAMMFGLGSATPTVNVNGSDIEIAVNLDGATIGQLINKVNAKQKSQVDRVTVAMPDQPVPVVKPRIDNFHTDDKWKQLISEPIPVNPHSRYGGKMMMKIRHITQYAQTLELKDRNDCYHYIIKVCNAALHSDTMSDEWKGSFNKEKETAKKHLTLE